MILNIHQELQNNFFEQEGITWWKTHPESPDLNPIENLWHELKEYIRREIKPTTKSELIRGIQLFWNTVDVQKCNKYINHLQKVFPHVIELNGAAIYWLLIITDLSIGLSRKALRHFIHILTTTPCTLILFK